MTEPAPSETADTAHGGLFGRGLLYVIVFSLPIVSASVISPVLAYLIGPKEFGEVAAAIALHQVLIVLAALGLDQALITEWGENSDRRRPRVLLSVAIITSASVTGVVALTAPLWTAQLGFGYFSPLVIATVLWTAPAAVVQVTLALLLSEDRIRAFTAVSLVSAVGGQVFGIGLLLINDRTAATYAWGAVISQFGAAAGGLIVARPRLRGLGDSALVKRAFRLGLPLVLGSLSVFVLNAGDRIIIQRELGPTEVGRYQVAYVLGYVVVLLVNFTTQAWAPRFASARDVLARTKLIASSRDELYRLLQPVILGIALAAPAALRILAPASFHPSSLELVVYLVALSAFPVAASTASSRALVTERRPRPVAISAAIAAVANVGLNLWFVPVFGIAGSATATVLAFGLQATLQVRGVSGRYPAWPRAPLRLWLSVLLTCAVAGVLILLPQTRVLISVRFGCAVFIALPWFVLRLRAARHGETALLPRRWRFTRRDSTTKSGGHTDEPLASDNA